MIHYLLLKNRLNSVDAKDPVLNPASHTTHIYNQKNSEILKELQVLDPKYNENHENANMVQPEKY